MSTPITLDLPHGVRRTTVDCARGMFAALEATPPGGTGERGTALLVPGYTGSKEDFIPILGPLAAAGRRVVAVDLRGQYQTPGPDDPAAYDLAELGADIAALARATVTAHLLGHSLGGLVARKACFPPGDDPPVTPPAGGLPVPSPWSLTLMCSGRRRCPGTAGAQPTCGRCSTTWPAPGRATCRARSPRSGTASWNRRRSPAACRIRSAPSSASACSPTTPPAWSRWPGSC